MTCQKRNNDQLVLKLLLYLDSHKVCSQTDQVSIQRVPKFHPHTKISYQCNDNQSLEDTIYFWCYETVWNIAPTFMKWKEQTSLTKLDFSLQ